MVKYLKGGRIMFNLISASIRIKEYFYSPILLEKIK